MSLKKIICLILNIICTLIICAVNVFTKINYSNVLILIVTSTTIIFLILFLVFNYFKLIKACKIITICNVVLMFVFTIYHLLNVFNMLYIFTSINAFRKFIISTGSKGVIIYIAIQALQVVFLPVPATIIALAGAVVYGPFWGSVYCSIGVLLGSYTSFWLGRTLGYKLVVWVAGRDNAHKYADMLNNSGKMFLGLAFLLPFFPDDVLCLIAGITTMSFRYFFIVSTLFRPIGVICMCYFGGGYIIPFSGWGIYVWIVIAVVMSIAVFLTYKYQNKMEQWFVNKFRKKKKNVPKP